MDFILSAEAVCGFDDETAAKYGTKIIPMKFYVDGKEYDTSDSAVTPNQIYQLMRDGAVTSTTQPNEFEIKNYFSELVSSGKDVLHLCMSSAMSGTYVNVKRIAEELNEEFANKIYVVDTLCQSFGIALLLIETYKKVQNENITVLQAVEFIESIKKNIIHCFAVDTLTYLSKGGRISPSLAVLGNLINVKPVIHVDNAGRMVMLHKVIGKRRALKSLVERFKRLYEPISSVVYISEADTVAEAEQVKAEILEFNPSLEVIIMPLCPVVGCHGGPGTVTVYFTGSEREA